MEKSRPKRLLRLIKKKEAANKPPEAASPTGKSPAKNSSAKPQPTSKLVTGKPSDTPVRVPFQTPGSLQQTREPSVIAKDRPPTAGPVPGSSQTDGKKIGSGSSSSSEAHARTSSAPEEPNGSNRSAQSRPASTSEKVVEVRPRSPVSESETPSTGSNGVPSGSQKSQAKSTISSERTAVDAEQVPEAKNRDDLVRYQALVGITSDCIFLITRDGAIEIVGPLPVRQPVSNGDTSGKQAKTERDTIAAATRGFVGRVASSLMEHGKQHINRAREDKIPQRFNFDSTIGGRLCHFRAQLVATEQGEVLAAVRDATGETLLNSSRTEAEAYRALLDKTADGLLVVDVETGRIRTCNESAASQFAFRAAPELTGMDLVDFVCDEDKERISNVIKDPICDLNSGQTLEFRAVRRDGVEIWIRAGISSADWNGVLARLISTTDVTELRRTEDALQISEERFHGLVQSTHDWVWEINTEGEYTYASPKVTDILGYKPEEVLGRTPLDLMDREEAERIVNEFVSVLSAREPFDGLRVVCLHKNGHAVRIVKSGIPFFAKEGRLLGYRGTDRDVSNGSGTYAGAGSGSSLSMISGMIQVIISIMETRDRYTAMHQQYVARLAADIASELGYTEDQVESVRIAGLMHDLGKMCIPSEILNKPGQLSRLETDILKGHPRAGYEILKNVEFPWPIGQMILQHHERMNGSGYPSGLRDDEILPEARILSVADVVVAMSSHRPYRPAQSLEKALREILENRGTLYDSLVVDACLSLASRKGFSFQEKTITPAASPIEYGVASGCAGLSFGI